MPPASAPWAMFSCETAAGGPHARALVTGAPAAIVELGPSDAYGIAGTVCGHRGVLAAREDFPALDDPTLEDLL